MVKKLKWILTSLAVCADSMSAYCISAWKVSETKGKRMLDWIAGRIFWASNDKRVRKKIVTIILLFYKNKKISFCAKDLVKEF